MRSSHIRLHPNHLYTCDARQLLVFRQLCQRQVFAHAASLQARSGKLMHKADGNQNLRLATNFDLKNFDELC